MVQVQVNISLRELHGDVWSKGVNQIATKSVWNVHGRVRDVQGIGAAVVSVVSSNFRSPTG